MKDPVGIEVAAGLERAKAEHGLGAVESPAYAGDIHAVLDQIATGTLDDAGGDGDQLFILLVNGNAFNATEGASDAEVTNNGNAVNMIWRVPGIGNVTITVNAR